MAESRTDQVSFGWATEAPEVAPGAVAATARKAPPSKAKACETKRSAPAPAAKSAKTSEPELPPDNELWDVHAAARFLKRSVSWVYHKAEDGTLPVTRLDGWGVRFIPGELRAWVKAGAEGRRRR